MKRFACINFLESRFFVVFVIDGLLQTVVVGGLGLVQSGIEVPCEMMVMTSGSVATHLFLTRNEKLLRKLHIEQKNEEIVATFLSVETEEGKEAEAKSRQQKKQHIKSKKLQNFGFSSFFCG